jgi:hypothetical protein
MGVFRVLPLLTLAAAITLSPATRADDFDKSPPITLTTLANQGIAQVPANELRELLSDVQFTIQGQTWETLASGKARLTQGAVGRTGGVAHGSPQDGFWGVSGNGMLCLEATAGSGARAQTVCRFIYRVRDGKLYVAGNNVAGTGVSPLVVTKTAQN